MVGLRMRLTGIFMPVLIIVLLGVLAGCGTGGLSDTPAASGGGGGTGGGGEEPPPPPPAAAISLGTDVVAVKSDNSSKATITATVLDANNAVIEGAEVDFSATGGAISAAKVTTNADGQAAITFRSGTQNQSNQVVTVTATTTSGRAAQIPIQVTGSTLTMTSTPPVNIPSDGSTTALLTVTAKNAGNVPVFNVPITLSVSGAGNVSLSASSGNTDLADGKIQVTVTGTAAGVVRVTAQGLGTSATYDYTVTGPALAVFGITAPPLDPTPQVTGTSSRSPHRDRFGALFRQRDLCHGPRHLGRRRVAASHKSRSWAGRSPQRFNRHWPVEPPSMSTTLPLRRRRISPSWIFLRPRLTPHRSPSSPTSASWV